METGNWRHEILKSTGIYVGHDTDLNSLRLLVLSNKPSYLYRYRSGHDYDLAALKEGYEWLSYPENYNDPFDARMFYDTETALSPALNKYLNKTLDSQSKAMIKALTGHSEIDIYGGRPDHQVLNKARKLHGLKFASMAKSCEEFTDKFRGWTDDIEKKMDRKIRNATLICSFTTHHSNYLMWAHYSNSHKGFCLEYKFSKPLIDHGLILPVSYRKKPVDVTELVKRAGANEKGAIHRASMGSALVKGNAWEYEDEWRYVCFAERGGRKLKGLQLNRVLLGCNASSELTYKVLDICRELGVEVVKQKRSPTSFDLVDGERLL